MSRFFDYNNSVFRILNAIADCLILGGFWIITSIPVFTMGAATTAVYYAVNKCIVHEKSHAYSEYWSAFKSNFKQATLAWLIWLALALFIVADLFVTRQFLAQGSQLGMLYYFFLVFSAVLIAWECYLFTYIARFESTLKETLVKTVVIMIANIGWSALLAAIFAVCIYICNDMQFLIFFLPGGFALVKNRVLERVYKKYRTPEDIAEELEANREFKN